MNEVKGPNSAGRIDEAAARRAAEEAARRAAEAAAQAAAQAAAAAAQAQAAAEAAKSAAQADAGTVSAGLEANAGPTGARALAARPAPPPGFEGFKGFGPPAASAGRADPNARINAGAPPVADPLGIPRTRQQADAAIARIDAMQPGSISKADMAALAALRGVRDPALQKALDGLATRVLNTPRQASLAAVKADPNVGRLLAPLQKTGDPATQAKLAETVKGWVTGSIDQNLQGKTGKEGVRQAMDAFKADMRTLAAQTGMGDALKTGMAEGLKAREGEVKDATRAGMAWYEKVGDFMGDVFNNVADFTGDVFKGVADVAGDAVHVLADVAADGVRAVSEVAGEVADATLDAAGRVANAAIDGAGEVVAAGLDAVGAESAARAVRTGSDLLGDAAELGLDAAGDVARDVSNLQGRIVGGAVAFVGAGVDASLDAIGKLSNAALDTAGAVVAEGPLGAAEKLANEAIGPEIPAYAGQIDGFTGVVANRLDKNQAAFVKLEGSAEIGAGAYAGLKVTGGARMGRDADGKITLTLEVAGEGEGGVRAKAKAAIMIGDQKIGVGGEAKAGGVVQAAATVTMTFDPQDPAAMARLKAITEPTPEKVAAAGGNPLAAATITSAALTDAMQHNFTSAEFTGAAGLRGSAKASAEVGPVAAKLGVKAEALAGGKVKFNQDGSQEVTLFVKGGASGEAALLAGGQGVGAKGNAEGLVAITVKTDKDGNLTGLQSQVTTQVGGQAGLVTDRKTDLAAGDRGLAKTKSNAQGGEGVTETTTRKLNDQALAEARRRIDAGENAIAVLGQLSLDPKNIKEARTTTTTDAYQFGFGVELALGVEVGLGASVTVGTIRTVTQEKDGEPALHRDMATDAPGGGGYES